MALGRFKLRTRVASANALLSALRTGSTWVEEEYEFWVCNAAAPPKHAGVATEVRLASHQRLVSAPWQSALLLVRILLSLNLVPHC